MYYNTIISYTVLCFAAGLAPADIVRAAPIPAAGYTNSIGLDSYKRDTVSQPNHVPRSPFDAAKLLDLLNGLYPPSTPALPSEGGNQDNSVPANGPGNNNNPDPASTGGALNTSNPHGEPTDPNVKGVLDGATNPTNADPAQTGGMVNGDLIGGGRQDAPETATPPTSNGPTPATDGGSGDDYTVKGPSDAGW